MNIMLKINTTDRTKCASVLTGVYRNLSLDEAKSLIDDAVLTREGALVDADPTPLLEVLVPYTHSVAITRLSQWAHRNVDVVVDQTNSRIFGTPRYLLSIDLIDLAPFELDIVSAILMKDLALGLNDLPKIGKARYSISMSRTTASNLLGRLLVEIPHLKFVLTIEPKEVTPKFTLSNS